MPSPWEEEAAPLRDTLLAGVALRGFCWGWPALESLIRLCQPLFVPARCDPEFIQEGLYRLSLGLNPYGAGAARAPPLLMFLYAQFMPSASHVSAVSNTLETMLSKPLPLGWQAVLWPRVIALLADMAGAVLVYAIAEAHISTDTLRLRASRAAPIFLKQHKQSQPRHQSHLKSEEKSHSDSLTHSSSSSTCSASASSATCSSSGLSDYGMTPAQVPGVAALLYMCHPAAVAAGCCGSTEALINLALLLAIWLAYCAAISRRAWAVLATGLAAGCAIYLDPMSAIYLPAIALIAAIPKNRVALQVKMHAPALPLKKSVLPPLRRPMVVLAVLCPAALTWGVLAVASAACLGPSAPSLYSRANGGRVHHLSLSWDWLRPVYAPVLGGPLNQPSISLQWYLEAIGFVRFRAYFRWLGTALLPALVLPLLIRLGSLPHPSAAAAAAADSSSPSPFKGRSQSLHRARASARATKPLRSASMSHPPSCGGLVVISSLACLGASGALGASDLSLRAHALALSLWACHLNLIATSHHTSVAPLTSSSSSSSSLASLSSSSPPQHEERKESEEADREDFQETKVAEKKEEDVFLFPFPWPPPLHGVLTVGMALTGTGIVGMWRMWLRGNGNANYVYFQSLAFAGFQGALGCGLLMAAVKRHDLTREGERGAQVALVCCVRRWLKSRHRRQKRSYSME